MEIIITICGRGGSKRIPKKNIKLVNGKPLIYYTLMFAKKIEKKLQSSIALSTDDEEIKYWASQYGIISDYNRPPALATDSAGKIDTIKHVLSYFEKIKNKKYDYIIDLDISSPMRTEEDIYSALELIKQDTKAFNIFSVSNADRNPYFNMVEEKKTGYYDLICKKSDYLTSQSAPIVYDLNASFYIYRKTFFENNYSTVYTPYTLIYKMPHICFDIDNQEDLEYLEYLIIKNKLKLEI